MIGNLRKKLIAFILAFVMVAGLMPAMTVPVNAAGTWIQRSSAPNSSIYSIFYANELFYILGDNGLLQSSEDLSSWTPLTSGVSTNTWGIAYGNSTHMLVGGDASNYSSGFIQSSSNGTVWTSARTYPITLTSVAYGNGTFVAGDMNGNVYYYDTAAPSPAWTKVVVTGFSQLAINSVTFANGKFVAVGGHSSMFTSGFVSSSEDGKTWTDISPVFPAGSLTGVCGGLNEDGDPVFVAVGNHNETNVGSIYFSYDGVAWEAITSGLPYMCSVAYGGGEFVAVGTGGEVRISDDGRTWSQETAGEDWLYSVAYGNGVFAVVNEYGAVYVKESNPAPSNTAPTASNVQVTGMAAVGSTLTGTYSYSDAEDDPDVSTYQWYRANDDAGTGKTVIPGATSAAYHVTSGELGKYLQFEVTPNDGTVAGAAAASVYTGPVTAQSLGVTGVVITNMTANTSPIVTTIEVAMPDLGLVAGDFSVAKTAAPGDLATVTNAVYESNKYILTVSGMTLYDDYTLRISNADYADYTNSSFYGTLVAASDIDIDPEHERNIFDTFTRTLTSDGVLTIANSTFAAGAKLYSGPVYEAIDGNNGNPDNGTSTRLIGVFATAPAGAKGVKTLRPDGQMLKVADDSLIDGNPNYQETIQSAKDYNTANPGTPNTYVNTLYAVPLYSQIATARQPDLSRVLTRPDDRFRIIAWYDNEDCTGNPVKVVRLIVQVSYTGTQTSASALPTVTGITPNSGSPDGGTVVTITGTNFGGATAVTIGGHPATNVSLVSSTSITAAVPAGTVGTADVSVTAPAGTGTGTGLYSYLDRVATPVASVDGGAVPSGTSVTLSCATAGAEIYYTTNGAVPTISSPHYTGAITINGPITIKAIAVKTGMNDSSVMTVSYTIIPKLPAPAAPAWDVETPGRAAWDAVANASGYTVQLYKDNAPLGDPATVDSGTAYDFSAVITSVGSYTFKVTAVGDGTSNYSSDASAASAALPAYAVIFQSDGSMYTTKVAISGSKLTAPAIPRKSLYTFGGWYKEAACTNPWNFVFDTATSATTLYAKWTKSAYTVTYAGNGATSGSVPADRNAYVSGSAVTVMGNAANLSKTGYTFSGWSDGSTTYTAGQTFAISADTTLSAVWTASPATYMATYSCNYSGADIYATQSGIAAGATLTAPASPGRSGYTFIGWYRDSACVIPWNFTVDTLTENTTLYAKWAASTYTVSGTVIDDQTPASGTVSGAQVKVLKGGVPIGTATTAGNGTFSIAGVPDGVYTLIVTANSGTPEVTAAVAVNGGNVNVGTVTLPMGKKSALLNVVGADITPVAADGLNSLLSDSTIIDSNAQNTLDNSGTVEIVLTVQPSADTAGQAKVQAAMSSGGYTSGSILDVDLTRTSIDSNGIVQEQTAITSTNTLIKLFVPLPAELQGKNSYVVYRAHDYGSGLVADTITATPNAGGEYIAIDSAKTQIIMHVKYFSTYAIAYSSGSVSPSGGGRAGTSYSIAVPTEGSGSEKDLPYYLDAKGNKVFLGFSSDSGGTMKYIAPEGKTVQFSKNPKSFTDISGHWGKSSIDFVTQRELFLGTGDAAFSPNAGMTRGMFAAVIGRLYERSYGMLTQTGISTFTDVSSGAYYSEYVNWAAANGIISGIGNNKFAPDRKITREEMAAILYRFAEFLKVSGADTEGVQLSYPDASEISSWAVDAAKYCQQTGIITGRESGAFAPEKTATRAEVSAILGRFIEIVI